MTQPPVGIDLGTTNSLVAAFTDGAPVLLANARDRLMTPSAVALQDGRVLVGQAAWDHGITAPNEVATAFKRRMGTDVAIPLGEMTMGAADLSALVLKALRRDAEARLGEAITEAVVSVPAYFNQPQREATRTACRLAGIEPLALVNEPTAAALAYGLQDREGESQFLVFDLGGGTFDVTVLEHFEGVMEVKASSGDGHLGGEDFTDALLRLLCRGAGLDESTLDVEARSRLRYYAEAAKRALSGVETRRFEFELDGTVHAAAIDVEAFEAEVEPLIRRMRRPLHRCLYDADGRERPIDRVILVGGATRMPLARKLVARELRMFPEMGIDPDHTVALGAAVHAALIKEDRALADVVMTDVSPFSVGMATSEGHEGVGRIRDLFLPIIPRNTPLPASREERVHALHLDQRNIRVDVYQGEAAHASDNVKLGTFDVPIPADPERERCAALDVRITQDVSGLIEVVGRIEGSKRTESLVVETQASQRSPDEIRRRMAALDHLKIHPMEDEANVAVLNRVKRLYEMADERDRPFLRRLLVEFERVLAEQDPKPIAEHRARLTGKLDAIDDVYVS